MKLLLIILFFSAELTLIAYDRHSATDCSMIAQLEITKDFNSEADNCCDHFCTCICCNSVPMKLEIRGDNTQPGCESILSLLILQIIPETYYEHWQPPKVHLTLS